VSLVQFTFDDPTSATAAAAAAAGSAVKTAGTPGVGLSVVAENYSGGDSTSECSSSLSRSSSRGDADIKRTASIKV